MEHTQNYHLPQWAESDRLLMADFNAAMERIEEGLTAAKTTADAAYSPARPVCVIGQYVGTGVYGPGKPTVINAGFRPSLLIIQSRGNPALSNGGLFIYPSVNFGEPSTFRWTDTGAEFSTGANSYPNSQFNNQGTTYTWIAFR